MSAMENQFELQVSDVTSLENLLEKSLEETPEGSLDHQHVEDINIHHECRCNTVCLSLILGIVSVVIAWVLYCRRNSKGYSAKDDVCKEFIVEPLLGDEDMLDTFSSHGNASTQRMITDLLVEHRHELARAKHSPTRDRQHCKSIDPRRGDEASPASPRSSPRSKSRKGKIKKRGSMSFEEIEDSVGWIPERKY